MGLGALADTADVGRRELGDARWGGNWVPRLLEQGITATWGAVEEPYANFYARGPNVFDGYWQYAKYLLVGLGVGLLVAGARHYSMSEFLGIRQIRTAATHAAITGTGTFDSTGVLGLTRHPWYVAVFVLIWAGDLNAAAITVNIVLTAYLVVGTLLEERKLVIEFGDGYRQYRDRVSMFIPLKWLTGRRSR